MSDFNVVFLDTNIFLRFLIRKDETAFRETKELLQAVEIRRFRAATSNLVIAELVWVLKKSYLQPKTKICESLEMVLHLPDLLMCDNTNAEIALELFRTQNVKYIDATIASIPQILSGEIPVISYDNDFGKLPVRWMRPSQYLSSIDLSRNKNMR